MKTNCLPLLTRIVIQINYNINIGPNQPLPILLALIFKFSDLHTQISMLITKTYSLHTNVTLLF